MSLPTLITADEFDEWPGVSFTTEDLPAVNAVLVAASTRVRKFSGSTYCDAAGEVLDDDIDDAVTTVVKLVAARVWNNPTGVSSASAGPFTDTWEAEYAELLKLTDTEESMIAATLDTPSPGLWVIPTTRGVLETPGPCRRGSANDLIFVYPKDGIDQEPILYGPDPEATVP